MPTFVRYWLFQIPGICVAAGLLAWAASSDWISSRTALLLLVAWVVKDAAFYPLTRHAYHTGESSLSPRIGQLATVRKPLEPRGTVTIDGVLWNARVEGPTPAKSGSTVRIVANKGLVLIVAPHDTDID